MTPEDNAQDQELLERYKRASNTLDAAPSDAVRAAILAEGRRAAEQRAAEPARRTFDVSRPAANDSRWRITAFGTAGAALVAALLFAPRLWESGPVAPATSSGAPAAAVRDQPTDEKASAPKLESLAPPSPTPSEPARAPALQPRSDLPVVPQRQQADSMAELAAPTDKRDSANAAPAAPPAVSAASRTAAPQAARISSLTAHAPAALLSAAASGDVAQTASLLDQGAAVDVRDELGRTPLMRAVMQSRLEVVRLLLDRGADPNAADNTGDTPLQQAKRQNSGEIAALLERVGAR